LENSPTAGGIRIANSNLCTTSTRCAWTGSTSIIGLAGKRILDVGCGGGLLSEGMALRGAEVTGIDLSEKPLERCQTAFA
jgi:2-polyprenyl-3-methyl-5-hydroxy-6-metoxy-1,4-benzoquinol methylase